MRAPKFPRLELAACLPRLAAPGERTLISTRAASEGGLGVVRQVELYKISTEMIAGDLCDDVVVVVDVSERNRGIHGNMGIYREGLHWEGVHVCLRARLPLGVYIVALGGVGPFVASHRGLISEYHTVPWIRCRRETMGLRSAMAACYRGPGGSLTSTPRRGMRGCGTRVGRPCVHATASKRRLVWGRGVSAL